MSLAVPPPWVSGKGVLSSLCSTRLRREPDCAALVRAMTWAQSGVHTSSGRSIPSDFRRAWIETCPGTSLKRRNTARANR